MYVVVLFYLSISGHTGKSLLYINSSNLMSSCIFLKLYAWMICFFNHYSDNVLNVTASKEL